MMRNSQRSLRLVTPFNPRISKAMPNAEFALWE